MSAKSPTSVRSREVIGEDQFSQRREVFDQHDTVFLPLPSPTIMVPVYQDAEPIVTSNHGKTTSNFKRNAPGYSSMRESRTEDRIEFRSRKYSDNFTSELNQNDDVDYRSSMTERTRRLSKLRRDFLNSNLHEPTADSPFSRNGARASLPATSASIIKYKIESPNLYKFPFAEPYATPPPVRRVVVDLGPPEVNGEKENVDPQIKPKHQSLPNHDISSKIDHQKLFEELVKRYSPQRKPVNWNLPPTRPRVVGSVPKSSSSFAGSTDSYEKKVIEENNKLEDDDVFLNVKAPEEEKPKNLEGNGIVSTVEIIAEKQDPQADIMQNGPRIPPPEVPKNQEIKTESDFKISESELEEKNDEVPELSGMQKSGKEQAKRPSLDKYSDLTIPALIEKITEREDLDNSKKRTKVKRKRSFLDKLLGRKKDK